MIVGFDFEAHMEVVVERDNAGIVLEHADAPVVVAQRFANRLGGGENGFLEHVVVLAFVRHRRSTCIGTAVMDSTGKRFMAAVFGPCLRDRFQFNVGGVAAQVVEVIANGLHFDKRQIQLAVFRECFESRVVK